VRNMRTLRIAAPVIAIGIAVIMWPKWDDRIDYGMASVDRQHSCPASLDDAAKTNFENCLCSASYSMPLIGHVAWRYWSPTMPDLRTMNPYSFVEWSQKHWKVCDAVLSAPIWPFHGKIESYRCSDHPDCIPPGGGATATFELRYR
jgi:hypothetical protein